MFDIIILIVVIRIIFQIVKKQMEGMTGNGKASAQPNQPRKQAEERKKQSDPEKKHRNGSKKQSKERTKEKIKEKEKEKQPDIMDRVDQQIYGTDASKADLERYQRYLEQERRTDIAKMAREMNCTMYQVIRDIRDFQDMGYFRNAEIDDDNYSIRYTDQPVRPGAVVREKHASVQKQQEEPVLAVQQEVVQPQSMPYMTMPGRGVDIPYMTMTGESKVSYMTMPEQGMDIYYNTIPEMKEKA